MSYTTSPGTAEEVTNETQAFPKGSGTGNLVVKQPGGTVQTVALQGGSLVPNLRRDLLSAKQAAKTSVKDVRIHDNKAYLGCGESACSFHVGNSGLNVIETKGVQRSRQL